MELALKMNNYFYREEADQYGFIRIPKMMIVGEDFSSLSILAKILYGMLLDRMSMARKNKWLDDEGKVYIVYPINEIQKDMSVSKKSVCDYLKELEKSGLVDRVNSGNGKPSRIYVKNYARRL